MQGVPSNIEKHQKNMQWLKQPWPPHLQRKEVSRVESVHAHMHYACASLQCARVVLYIEKQFVWSERQVREKGWRHRQGRRNLKKWTCWRWWCATRRRCTVHCAHEHGSMSTCTCNVSISRDWDKHGRSVGSVSRSMYHNSVGLAQARPNYMVNSKGSP